MGFHSGCSNGNFEERKFSDPRLLVLLCLEKVVLMQSYTSSLAHVISSVEPQNDYLTNENDSGDSCVCVR